METRLNAGVVCVKYMIEKINVLYFIGSSGVGKSSVCKKLSDGYPNIIYYELDKVYREYRNMNKISQEEAIKNTKDEIEKIDNSNKDKIYLVDVGNFAQKMVDIYFWEQRKGVIVSLINSKEFCIKNYIKRGSGRTEQKWLKAEKFNNREKLYSLAKYSIDSTGLSEEETKQKVINLLEFTTNSRCLRDSSELVTSVDIIIK